MSTLYFWLLCSAFAHQTKSLLVLMVFWVHVINFYFLSNLHAARSQGWKLMTALGCIFYEGCLQVQSRFHMETLTPIKGLMTFYIFLPKAVTQ